MDLTSFLPDIFIEADGVPEPVALNAVRHALREMCQRSDAWAVDLDPITVVDGDNAYTPSLPVGSELAQVLTATMGTRSLAVTTIEDIGRADPGWRTKTANDVQAVMANNVQVLVYPTPNRNLPDSLVLRAALRPTLTGSTCADVLGRYTEAVACGALARLKIMPAKPWSDREGVALYNRLFHEGVNRARTEAMKGFTSKSLSVLPRRFGQ